MAAKLKLGALTSSNYIYGGKFLASILQQIDVFSFVLFSTCIPAFCSIDKTGFSVGLMSRCLGAARDDMLVANIALVRSFRVNPRDFLKSKRKTAHNLMKHLKGILILLNFIFKLLEASYEPMLLTVRHSAARVENVFH